MNIFLASFF